jgi:hypothetical protein
LSRRAVAAAAALVALAGCIGGSRTEARLRAHLARNRSAFDRLVQMSNEDFARARVVRVNPEYTYLADNRNWPRREVEWGMSRARWDEYRALFRDLELAGGLARGGHKYDSVLLIAERRGFAAPGTEWGLLWSPTPPTLVDNEQEAFSATLVEGAWYTYEWTAY